MPRQKIRSGTKWTHPNTVRGKKKYRYCKICGKTADQVPIMKHENICETCVKELEKKKEGHLACKICGKVVPKQVKENKGFCDACVCSLCGKPDPKYTRKHGMCKECMLKLGTHCIDCGKEAMAQVRKNDGFCDICAAKAREKNSGGR